MLSTKKILSSFLAGVMCFSLAACGAKEEKPSSEQNVKYEDEEINVSAASSLTNCITEIAEKFEEETGVKVNLNFAGSNALKTQIKEGFDVDMFFSANFKHYDELDKEDYFTEGEMFVKNSPVLIVTDENETIKSMEDLTNDGVKFITTNGEVPIGKYTREVLENLNAVYGDTYKEQVMNNIASEESNVRQVVSKVALGEGDCGLVYKTDVTADFADKLTVIEIEPEYNVIGDYWKGFMKTASESDSAKAFYDFTGSDFAKEVFANAGFVTEL